MAETPKIELGPNYVDLNNNNSVDAGDAVVVVKGEGKGEGLEIGKDDAKIKEAMYIEDSTDLSKINIKKFREYAQSVRLFKSIISDGKALELRSAATRIYIDAIKAGFFINRAALGEELQEAIYRISDNFLASALECAKNGDNRGMWDAIHGSSLAELQMHLSCFSVCDDFPPKDEACVAERRQAIADRNAKRDETILAGYCALIGSAENAGDNEKASTFYRIARRNFKEQCLRDGVEVSEEPTERVDICDVSIPREDRCAEVADDPYSNRMLDLRHNFLPDMLRDIQKIK